MANDVIYKIGQSSKLDDCKKVEGQILITEDKAEMFIDLANDNRRRIAAGQSNLNNSEIFNNYKDNEAISTFSTSIGDNTTAGGTGYLIANLRKFDTTTSIDLYNPYKSAVDYPKELSVGDIVSLDVTNNYCDVGKILDIQLIVTGTEEKPLYYICLNIDGKCANPTVVDGESYLWIKNKTLVEGNINIGTGAHASGGFTQARQIYSHAEGYMTTANGKYAHTEGRETYAGYSAHAEGRSSEAIGAASHAEGQQAKASGSYSHAEGCRTQAIGLASHSEGQDTTASGKNSHSEGQDTTASGENSHSEGLSTTASGYNTHAEGNETEASGQAAHAEGLRTIASGRNAHAEGQDTTASAYETHAEGQGSIARSYYCHAEGKNTIAGGDTADKGQSAHAEGNGTQATGNCSHAGGDYTFASGSRSFTHGYRLNAKEDCQFVVGKCNKDHSNTLFIVGNGSAPTSRSNAFEVFLDSHAELPNLKNSSGQLDSTAIGTSSFSIATKGYVDNALNKIKLAEVVGELPEKGETNKLYLLPAPLEESDGKENIFFEYVWANNTWERLGTKQIEIDLTDYVKNTDYPTSTKAGAVKIVSAQYGIGHNDAAGLYTIQASKAEIDAKVSQYLPLTPKFLDYAVKTSITTNTETLTEEEKTKACKWLGISQLNPNYNIDLEKIAPAIKNIISGGEKSLIVNDVSPLEHKCSLRLTSDRYESRNIYKFDNIEFNNEHENSSATFTLNENGTFTIAGGIWADASSRFYIYVDATKLTLNKSYMYSLRDNDNNFLSPYCAVTIYKDGSVDEDFGDNAKYQIGPTEDISSYCFMYGIIGDKFSDDQLMSYINKTFYPQLEAGTIVTEWQEYGSVSYIKDFNAVTVNVNGAKYTPNADGTVTIDSISPTMEIITDNEHANICDFTYCADTKKYIDTAIINAELGGEVDLSDYVTKDELENYVTEIPEEYITEDELNAKGYLTQHQDLSSYATINYVDDKIKDIPTIVISESEPTNVINNMLWIQPLI